MLRLTLLSFCRARVQSWLYHFVFVSLIREPIDCTRLLSDSIGVLIVFARKEGSKVNKPVGVFGEHFGSWLASTAGPELVIYQICSD